MKIDTHQHVFWQGRDDAGLIRDMDEHGVDVAWLLTWEIPPDHDIVRHHGLLNPLRFRANGTHAGVVLEDLLIARDHFPDRFLLGYCPDPCLGDAPGLLEAAHRMHGVTVCGEWKYRVLFDDPRCLNLFRKAGELAMPVVLHLDVPYRPDSTTGELVYDPFWYGGTIQNLERALVACPHTIFVGHAPGFWREISSDVQSAIYPEGPIQAGGEMLRLLETYPNLYADLSAGSALCALRRDLMFSRDLLERHKDRFLYGRDTYGGELDTLLGELDLSAEAMSSIESGNARRLISLP